MWVCSNCKRKFKTKNQSHSCDTVPVERHFTNSNAAVFECYKKIKALINKYSPAEEISTQSAILYTIDYNFLALKPKKSWLDIEFVLSEPYDEFPIHKVVQASKNRFAHFLRVEEPSEIDTQLEEWIKMSCQENT